MDELTIVRNAVKYFPTFAVVGLFLSMLTDEYLRQMELRGLIRKRTTEPEAKSAQKDVPGAKGRK